MTEMLTEPQTGPARLRIGWIAGSDTFANMGRTLKPLAIGLMGEMVDVTVITPTGADIREVPTPPVELVHYSPGGWLRSARTTAAALAEELTKRRIDALHGLDIRQAELTCELARLCSVPHVISCQTFNGAGRLRRHDPHPDAVLASGDIIAAELREHLHLPGDQIQLVRPGVHHDGQVTCFTDSSRIASIVIDGRCGSFSALETAIRAFAGARQRQLDCACFLIGAGRWKKRLRRLGETLEIHQDLTYVDPPTISQMPGILSGADIYIVPMATSEVNIWALMAMAAGTAVLAADAPEDFFIDGHTVRLFAKGDVLDLTEKLAGFLTDHICTRQLAQQAVEHVGMHHSPAEMVSAIVGTYRKLRAPVSA